MSEINKQPRNPEEPETYIEDIDKATYVANVEKFPRDRAHEARESRDMAIDALSRDNEPTGYNEARLETLAKKDTESAELDELATRMGDIAMNVYEKKGNQDKG